MLEWLSAVIQGVALEAAMESKPKAVEKVVPFVPSRRALHLQPAMTRPRHIAPSLLSDQLAPSRSTLFVSDFDKTLTGAVFNSSFCVLLLTLDQVLLLPPCFVLHNRLSCRTSFFDTKECRQKQGSYCVVGDRIVYFYPIRIK
jgi:hypothetical protein